MPEGLVSRMAIEWGFLILLAVGAAVADLTVLLIILVMAIGWILVVLVELVAWRARPGYAVTESVEEASTEFAEWSPGPVSEEADMPPLQPPIPPAYDFEFKRPADTVEDTAVTEPAPAEEPERPALDPEDPYAPAPERDLLREADQRVVHRLEPLKPRPRRRWFR